MRLLHDGGRGSKHGNAALRIRRHKKIGFSFFFFENRIPNYFSPFQEAVRFTEFVLLWERRNVPEAECDEHEDGQREQFLYNFSYGQ